MLFRSTLTDKKLERFNASHTYKNVGMILSSVLRGFIIELFGIKILLVHGSPRKNNENIYPNLKIKEVEEMISNTNADVIFCGHTHMPCVKIERGIIVMNPGSLTEPRGGSKPSYGIIKIENGKIYPMVIPYI